LKKGPNWKGDPEGDAMKEILFLLYPLLFGAFCLLLGETFQLMRRARHGGCSMTIRGLYDARRK
jgi:hypothetical protein